MRKISPSQSPTCRTIEPNRSSVSHLVTLSNSPFEKLILSTNLDSNTNQTSTLTANNIPPNSTAITLDSQAISQQNRLTFSIYNHQDGLFNEEQHRVVTRVVSLTIDKPELTKGLGSFVKISFHLENRLLDKHVNVTCAYWHIFENLTAQWSTEGCALVEMTERNIMCECNHLTHFAVLMVGNLPLLFSCKPFFFRSGYRAKAHFTSGGANPLDDYIHWPIPIIHRSLPNNSNICSIQVRLSSSLSLQTSFSLLGNYAVISARNPSFSSPSISFS